MPNGDEKPWAADKVERWPLDRLIPYAKNSRTHSPAQVKQIVASIKEWGWTIPVLADPDGNIICGHGRVMAAEELGIKSVPVMIAEGWTDAQKRAYVIADNKLALNSGWDEDVLAMELGDLSSEEFDLSVIGFSAKALDEFLAADALDPTMPDLGPKKMISAHTCPACGHQWVEDDE